MQGLVRIVFLLAAALACARASGATRLEIDAEQRGLFIRVDEDAPGIIELKSEDLLPIRWERQGLRDALLPAIATQSANELTIVDDSRKSYALVSNGALPKVRVDPQRYAADVGWHGQPTPAERTRIVLLGVVFSLGLLLVLLLRRRAVLAACLYCAAWIGGLAWMQYRAPSLVVAGVHPEVPMKRVFARDRETLRFPITARSNMWLPIVESTSHLQSLSMRIEVKGDAAELVVDLPRDGKLYLGAMRYVEGFDDAPSR